MGKTQSEPSDPGCTALPDFDAWGPTKVVLDENTIEAWESPHPSTHRVTVYSAEDTERISMSEQETT